MSQFLPIRGEFLKAKPKDLEMGKELGQGRDAARAEHTQPWQGAGRTFSSEKVSEVNWAGQCSDKGWFFCNLLIRDSTFFLFSFFFFLNYFFFSAKPPDINSDTARGLLVWLNAIKFFSLADSKGEVRGKDVSLPGRDVMAHHHFRRGNLPLNKSRSFCGGTGVWLERA